MKQADGYRTLLSIDTMFMVNFVPQGHVVDNVFEVIGYSAVKVIHIQFPDSCDRYDLQFLENMGRKPVAQFFALALSDLYTIPMAETAVG